MKKKLNVGVNELFVIFQRQWTLEVFVANRAVITVSVFVTLDVLFEEIFTSKSSVTRGAWKFIRICVKSIVPSEIVQSGIIFSAYVAREFTSFGVTTLMVTEITFLSKSFTAGATSHLVRLVLTHVQMIRQFFLRAEFFLAK